jgi:hypothetical protein
MNCPFYGVHYVQQAHPLSWIDKAGPAPHLAPFFLFPQGGNECAIVATAFSPCYMELRGQVPDWRTCSRVIDIRGRL